MCPIGLPAVSDSPVGMVNFEVRQFRYGFLFWSDEGLGSADTQGTLLGAIFVQAVPGLMCCHDNVAGYQQQR